MTRRCSDAEVEALMIPQLVQAIYPVLIPVEQQAWHIQAENHKRMTELATQLWRSFTAGGEG